MTAGGVPPGVGDCLIRELHFDSCGFPHELEFGAATGVPQEEGCLGSCSRLAFYAALSKTTIALELLN